MKRIVFTLCIAALLWMCKDSDKADFVLLNGKIYTADAQDRFVEAVAVKAGIIVDLGPSQKIENWIGPSTEILDAKRHLVTPGFIDAHCHFASGDKSLMTLSFRGVDSLKKIQEMVAEKVKDLPQGAPVFGSQFDHTLFPKQKWPCKEDLDEVSPHNPVVIKRIDGHSVWVNSMALEQSGIDRNSPDPFGGEIVRDSRTGEPTGILKETAAGLLKVQKPDNSSSPEEDIKRGLEHAASLGITSIHTAAGLDQLEIYKQLDQQGYLTLRVFGWLPYKDIDVCIKRGIRQGVGDDKVKTGFLKIFVDGTISSSTALLFEPFSDEPDKSGLPQHKKEELNALVEKAHKYDFQVGMHAIGDKAIHWALNAVEQAQQKHGSKGLRHRIEHVSVLHLDDVLRFRALGVIPSMQPTFCTTDLMYCEQRFGKDRCRGVYVWKSLLESGSILAFGTDWPVEPLDPMRGLYSCVTRKSIDFGVPENGWFPGQCLKMAEAIKYYTFGSAYAAREEDVKGTLEKGKLADMTVLSKDLFTVDPEDILSTKVLYTILGGKIVFRRN
jgi:hypothetical protein